MAIISISDSQVNGANEILVADSNSKIPAVDGSQITILNASNVASGTIATARLDVGTTANKLVQLDGSGNLPAVDASQLTGIVSATISASDPAIDTNPSGGVGTEWNNSTSGEMYICTDATTDENVWKNVGAGSGNISPIRSVFQGTQYGYCGGGENGTDVIDKFSYTSDADATNVGVLASVSTGGGCQGSAQNGYQTGQVTGTTTYINKWSFSSDGNGTNVGSLPNDHKDGPSGHSSPEYGYAAGGYQKNHISKFAFESESTTTDVGNLTVTNHGAGHAGVSAYDYGGFVYGGYPNTDVIDKFSFASDGDATDHANLTTAMRDMNGQSGLTHGYACFGYSTGYINDINKFPYASQTNATDVADMTLGWRGLSSGTASTTHGYSAGGTSGSKKNMISKNSHVSDGNEVDVGDLTVARSHFAGTGIQV